MDKEDLDDLLKRAQFKPLPYDVEQNYKRLQGNIRAKEVVFTRSKRVNVWRYVGIAATVALLFMTTWHVMNLQPDKNTIWYEITAVPDAKTKVILPDSSVVWLNANASLRYPHSFERDHRSVMVSGDATFDVMKDEKPFIVELDQLKVKVLGTVFNVMTDSRKDEVEVTLLEGKIALYTQDDLTGTPDRILEPDQQAVYRKSTRNILVSSVRTDAVNSWITGNFYFEGNTLAEITKELERAFHTKIHIENELMSEKTFNAVFEDKETLEEILSILQISARYKIDKRRGEIYIN